MAALIATDDVPVAEMLAGEPFTGAVGETTKLENLMAAEEPPQSDTEAEPSTFLTLVMSAGIYGEGKSYDKDIKT